jgi:hypothetical protein
MITACGPGWASAFDDGEPKGVTFVLFSDDQKSPSALLMTGSRKA